MRTSLPVLALIGVSLAVGGCGGAGQSSSSASKEASVAAATSSTSSTGPSTTSSLPLSAVAGLSKSGVPLTTAQLVAGANRICGRVNERLAKTPSTVEKLSDFARIAPVHAAIEQDALTELGRLRPPASLAAEWQQMLAGRDAMVVALTKIGQDAAVGAGPALRAVARANDHVVEEMTSAAHAVGIVQCARAD